MSILHATIAIFINQFIFIGCRTWNIRAIAAQNIKQALISSVIVNLTWMINIAIGSVSMYEILANVQWQYFPVIIASVTAGTLGTYLAMLQTPSKTNHHKS